MLKDCFSSNCQLGIICNQTFPNICELSGSSRTIGMLYYLRNNLKMPKFIGYRTKMTHISMPF